MDALKSVLLHEHCSQGFLHNKKGSVFSSPLSANLQENELGVVCINETIKESLES